MNGQLPLVNLTLKNLNDILINRVLPLSAQKGDKKGGVMFYFDAKPFCPTQEFTRINRRLNDGETKRKPQLIPFPLVIVILFTMFWVIFIQEIFEMIRDEAK